MVAAGVVIVLIALLGFASRYKPYPPMPVKVYILCSVCVCVIITLLLQEHPDVVSGGIWAFHFGYDNSAFPSMERAAQLIQNSGTYVDIHMGGFNMARVFRNNYF